MPNTSISNLSAGAAVSATDVVPNVQTAGVGPVKTTAAQIKTFTSSAPTITGHPTIEGVTSTGATGTGNLVFSAAPTFTGTVNGADLTLTGTATAVSFSLASSGIITESTTTRTLSSGDNGKVIYCTNGSATTINCAGGLGAGFSCTIIQGGAGKVTVAANGQTLVSYSSLFSTMGQYAVISLVAPVANTFLAAGNLGV